MIPASTHRPPLVSIIINNYNYGRFLREAIESALNQTPGLAEVILVDDGSTDDSRTIMEDYRGRAQIVFKTNGGQASAFNAGLPLARGGVVLFLDSDDYLLPNAAERIAALWRPDLSRCHFRLRKVDADGQPLGEEPPVNVPLASGDLFEAQLSRNGCIWVPTSGNAFRREYLRQIFPVDERFRICADSWLFFHSAAGGGVLAIEEVLGAYRVHGANYFAANDYTVPPGSDAVAHKMLNSRVSGAHAKIQACLALKPGLRSPAAAARRHLSLATMRLLLLAKYFGIAGPLPELDRQFTRLRLHRLILFECLHNRAPLNLRMRCLTDMVLMPLLPKSRRMWWVRHGFGAVKPWLRRRARGGG